jgi:hypothetical protein
VELQGFGFQVSADPAAQSVWPGGQAAYALSVQALGAFSETVTLTTASPSPSLTVTLAPGLLTPPATAVLTATSLHVGTFQPGLWFTIPVTATGGGLTQTLSLGLLVGGARLHMPFAVR